MNYSSQQAMRLMVRLLESDGTTAGTVMVKDTHTSSTTFGPTYLTVFGSELFFSLD